MPDQVGVRSHWASGAMLEIVHLESRCCFVRNSGKCKIQPSWFTGSTNLIAFWLPLRMIYKFLWNAYVCGMVSASWLFIVFAPLEWFSLAYLAPCTLRFWARRRFSKFVLLVACDSESGLVVNKGISEWIFKSHKNGWLGYSSRKGRRCFPLRLI